jgi:molecular chaperone GrpE
MADESKKHDPSGNEPELPAPRRPAHPDGDIRIVDRRWWAKGTASDAGAEQENRSDKPAYVQELEQRLAAKDEELRATIARYREANAEFEQARARLRRDVAKEVERGKRAILADLLDVLDNLDRALAAACESSAAGPLLQGVELVRAQFLGKLESLGVRVVDASGQRFDPARHEAVTTVPVTDPAKDGLVVGVVRQGYAIGDDVLRPAVVAVAKLTLEGAPS